MKEMLYNQEVANEDGELYYCPRYVNAAFFEKTAPEKQSPAMMKGNYFETLVLGSCRGGKKITDLPRKSLTKVQESENLLAKEKGESLPHIGEKTLDQERIEQQAVIFRLAATQLRMKVVLEGENKNTQIPVYKQWDKYPNEYPDVTVRGEIDIYNTPVFFDDDHYPKAVVDLKLTANIHNKYGRYCWGKPEYMDHTQGIVYTYLTGMPFFYLVFDYKPNPEWKPVYVRMTPTRLAELHECIRKIAEKITSHDAFGWEPEPDYNRCRYCPLNYKNGGECNEAITAQIV